MNEPVLSSGDDEAYRPISGFALAGLFLGGGFAAIVAGSAAIAIVKGAPIFFPLWLLLMPIAGFVLALFGRGQIAGPNPTRDGLRLANIAILLSVFSGLGYTAYYVSVGLAVTSQAEDFVAGEPDATRGFLKHLMRGDKIPADLDIAFLLTRPATARIKYRPGDDEIVRATYDQPTNDGQAGEVSRFKNRKFVRMITQGGEETTFDSLGVREWDYDKTSYKVARNYRVSTPQATFDILIFTESTEPELEGQLRQWFVNFNRMNVEKYNLTPLGTAIDQLNDQSRKYLESQWQPKTRDGKAVEDFKKFDKTDWPRVIAEASDRGKNKKIASEDHYKSQARDLFEGRTTESFSVLVDNSTWPDWGQDADGRFWIDHPIRMTFYGNAERSSVSVEGRLRIRTKAPFDPAKYGPNTPEPEWNVEDLVIERLRPSRGS